MTSFGIPLKEVERMKSARAVIEDAVQRPHHWFAGVPFVEVYRVELQPPPPGGPNMVAALGVPEGRGTGGRAGRYVV